MFFTVHHFLKGPFLVCWVFNKILVFFKMTTKGLLYSITVLMPSFPTRDKPTIIPRFYLTPRKEGTQVYAIVKMCSIHYFFNEWQGLTKIFRLAELCAQSYKMRRLEILEKYNTDVFTSSEWCRISPPPFILLRSSYPLLTCHS